MRILLCVCVSFLLTPLLSAEGTIALRCGRLIDGNRAPQENAVIWIEGERIHAVGANLNVPVEARVIDLGSSTCLPGLIDSHTHVLLEGDITAADYDAQLLKESIPYRAIRATAAARTALLNGFTTIRDLETEGAMYADVDLKKAIDRGIVPGPRIFPSTRAMAPTGMYPLNGYSWELRVPEGVQIVDGADAIRKAVREQVKYGAEWIKYYSDRAYFVKDGALRSRVNFTDEEAKALVDEAHRLGRRVAAHAMAKDGIEAALQAGVDTIEHGYGLDEHSIDLMVRRGVFWCPTLFVGTYVAEGRASDGAPIWKAMVGIAEQAFRKALRMGVKIAFSTDAGGFPWKINEAREFSIMVAYGMSPAQAIRSATSVGAALLDRETELGAVEPGHLADIIALKGDPLKNIADLEHVTFVMKGGIVVKNE